ncbi:MAG: glycosyltransferase, partial [Spirochaetaceae bacterium]|nr:glycosyltransferase [Spirochaetaceae bacterium]
FAHVPTQVGMYGAAIADIPFSFTSHANDLFQHGILLKEKVRRSKKAITISAHNKRFLVAHHADPRHIQIVRCGVALTPGYTRLAAERDVPVIGSLGRLVEKKGMDPLLRACAELHHEGVTFRLQIAGGGPLQKSLQTLAAQLHIAERVEFLGPLDHDRVFAWLEGLDVFALACRKDKNGDTDGIPVVLMEAMVRCVPVVSTAISGIPELIEHNRTGLLSRPEDLNAFTTNLRRILQNRESAAAMAKCGRERVEAEFSRDVNTERLLQVFMS